MRFPFWSNPADVGDDNSPHRLTQARWDEAGLSQLRMVYPSLDRSLPHGWAAPGYTVRPFTPDRDEGAWIEILSTGDFGIWDRARLDRMRAGDSAQVPSEGVFFSTYEGIPVGVACLFLYDSGSKVPGKYHGVQTPFGELGWVAVLPDHRGRGVAYDVCRAVMKQAKALGCRSIHLTTEDFRLGAIKTYLRLGFEPVMIAPDHAARWKTIRRVLDVE